MTDDLRYKLYQIDFGLDLRCQIRVTDKGLEVERAVNGWGDTVKLMDVKVIEIINPFEMHPTSDDNCMIPSEGI